ncbi:NitT/TauT family transport system substrate-binding protein [Acinetobacter calcoaceticus]|uniref:NitT/TauT family transport system substrate-binding protein n=1 Tax=Acinetobacter calcoaceticus TaxID=471 RepID=A0A4R1X8P7_ACICA|nr:NitT/TauT family transport system substrate-binding protein [Acinetobacter calcoaceticus]
MLRAITLSSSVLVAIIVSGCDNTAKVPLADATAVSNTETQTIRIGYSDWPGWVAWQVAIEKGWLKDAGLAVEFKWFDYSASMAAFTADQLDAITVSNGDSLLLASGGADGVMIMATDYSAGNDVIIAKSGINSISDLKGKTVALEKGLVDHLLLNAALEDHQIDLNQTNLTNAVSNELPQVLNSPDVSAIAVWQPVANQALKAVAGTKVIYSSKDKPGLIYDTLTVKRSHLAQNPAQWQKIVQVWDKTVHYINDPATQDDALKIMANRVGVEPQQYKHLMNGMHLLDVAANNKVFGRAQGLDSIYGSSYHVNQFNLNQGIYQTAVDVDRHIDSTVLERIQTQP